MKITIETRDDKGTEEVEVDLTATTDPVVASCDLITITTTTDRAGITIPIDPDLRETSVGKALQTLWDAINETDTSE